MWIPQIISSPKSESRQCRTDRHPRRGHHQPVNRLLPGFSRGWKDTREQRGVWKYRGRLSFFHDVHRSLGAKRRSFGRFRVPGAGDAPCTTLIPAPWPLAAENSGTEKNRFTGFTVHAVFSNGFDPSNLKLPFPVKEQEDMSKLPRWLKVPSNWEAELIADKTQARRS